MTAVELVVFGTVSASVICWALAEGLRHRGLWTAGAALMLVHSVAAFFTFYGGSHTVARAETARQTAALTSVDFSGGIYINYAFLTLWVADALWWNLAPASHARRPVAASLALRGFICFIIFNGAVIFADGWARVVGVTAVALAAAGLVRRVRGTVTSR